MGQKKTSAEEDSLKKILYKAAQPALLAMRVVGYLPSSVSKEYEVTNRICSIPFFWSAIVLSVLLFGTSQIFGKQDLLFRNKFVITKMDKVCKLLVAWTFMLSACGLGIKALLSTNATKEFWSLNYMKLEELGQINQRFDLRSAGFLILKRKIARSTTKWTLLAGCFCIFMTGIGAMQTTLEPLAKATSGSTNKSNDTAYGAEASESVSGSGVAYLLGMMVSFFVAHLYIIISVYVSFFLQLYGACLKVITTDMRKCCRQFPGSHSYLIKVDSTSGCKPDAFTKQVKDCIRGYYIIKDLVDAFSRHFTFELTIVLAVSLITILTSAFFGIYHGFHDVMRNGWLNLLFACIRIVAYAVLLYAIASVSTGLTGQADQFREELVKIDMELVSTSMQAKIQLTANDIAMKPPAVAPGYFYVFNRQLLVSILSCITTYLVILIQFRHTEF